MMNTQLQNQASARVFPSAFYMDEANAMLAGLTATL